MRVFCRIVEIRSCTDGPAHVIDWADNHDSVIVSGNAIWQGNMALKGKLTCSNRC